MTVFFWYLMKIHSSIVYYCTMENSLFQINQKNTTMFIWSPCWSKLGENLDLATLILSVTYPFHFYMDPDLDPRVGFVK